MSNNNKVNDSDTVVNIELQEVTGDQQLFKKLSDLISSTPSDDSESHLAEIRDIFNENTEKIYGTSINGRNIFHVIAADPSRNPEILKIFGLANGSFREYISQQKLKDLLHMKYGKNQRAPIHLAIQNGFAAFVELMLDLCPELIDVKDAEKYTPLHFAAMSSLPEAVDCIRCIQTATDNYGLIPDILINMRNDKCQNPLHSLCLKVPKNEDANVKAKLDLLMTYNCTTEILKNVDKSKRTPLHLLCCREEQLADDVENPNLAILVEGLTQDRDNVNYLSQDVHRQTALHLACISEFPVITKILANHPRSDITIKDAHGRMPIHYAAEKCIKPSSHKCVKALADWSLLQTKMRSEQFTAPDNFRNYLLWTTDSEADSKDGTVESNRSKIGDTALTLSCKAKSARTTEFILRNVYEAKCNSEAWFLGKDHEPEIFSLKQVYKYTPEALKFLFDESISIDVDDSNECRIEFTTNLSVITALTRPVQRNRQPVSEVKYLSYSKKWPEDVREKLLLHPLTKCTLYAAWQRMYLYNLLWLFVNIIWLASYTCLIPYKYSEKDGGYQFYQFVASCNLAIITVMYSINELLEIKISGVASYMQNALTRVNIWHWLQIALTSVAIYKPLYGLGEPSAVEKYCGAVGAVLSFILFWRNIGIIYLPLGIQVEYLVETLKKILVALVCCIPIIIGFEIAFMQILPEHFSGGSIWSLIKTLVMMTGEFEYNDMFNEKEDAGQGFNLFGSGLASRTVNLLTFVVFFVVVPVTFYNLITGQVVDKVKQMERRIEMHQTENHIRLVNYVQRTMISKFDCVASFFVRTCFVSYRPTQDGQTVFDQDIKWYIDKYASDSIWSRIWKGILRCNEDGPLCANFLSEKVTKKFFETYQDHLEATGTKSACALSVEC